MVKCLFPHAMTTSRRDDFRGDDALWWLARARQGATDKRVNSLLHKKNFPSIAMAKRAARAYTFSSREKGPHANPDCR
jgi:hypothetical protein